MLSIRGCRGRQLAVAVLAWVAMAGTGEAQQQYNSTLGYACNGAARTCSAYALYRTFQGGESLSKVGGYFNETAASVSNVSGLGLMAPAAGLKMAQPLYVPLDCSCRNVTTQMLVQHTIVAGDTFWLLSVTIYGGLTTYQAMIEWNPTKNVYDLQIGDTIVVPIFCACPTAAQVASGATLLLTHTVYAGETLPTVSAYYGISTAALAAANKIGSNNTLGENTTLLVPLPSLPPLATIDFAALPAPPAIALPPTTPPTAAAPVVYTKSASHTPLYVGIAVGAFGLTLAAVFGALLLLKKSSSGHRSKASDEDAAKALPGLYDSRGYYQNAPSGSTKHSGVAKANAYHLEMLEGMSDVVGSDKPILLSYQELQDATQDFGDENLIQGSVYRGRINGQLVAIKQTKGNMSQELKILCQVHHSNLVKLVGMCVGGSEHLFLVYEYAENGSLNDCLRNQSSIGRNRFSQSTAYLPWTARVRIALDVASGLDYIHNYTNPSFVHKDVKSSNILLDGSFRAKVANFGMAKPAATAGAGPHLTRHIDGTQGYMAPEYLEHGLVTVKADVFAFGVVLLEILSGKDAVVRPEDDAEKERALSDIVFDVLVTSPDRQSLQLRAFMDPQLHSAYPLDIATSIASLAKTCVESDPAVRPSMKDVTFALSKMLAASLDWEASAGYGSGLSTVSIEAR